MGYPSSGLQSGSQTTNHQPDGLAEALRFNAKLAVQAADPKTVDLWDRRSLVHIGGQVIRVVEPPPPIRLASHSLKSFLSAAAFLHQRFKGPDGKSGVVVYQGAGVVCASVNDPRSDAGDDPDELHPEGFHALAWGAEGASDLETAAESGPLGQRRHRAVLFLTPSKVYEFVSKGTHRLLQSEFIRLLRVDLFDHTNASSLIPVLRQVKFKLTKTGESEVGHGREAMGISDEAEMVSGADRLPEVLNVSMHRWANVPDDQPKALVRCPVTIKPKEQVFVIEPMREDMARAEAEAEAWLHGFLVAELEPLGIPVVMAEDSSLVA